MMNRKERKTYKLSYKTWSRAVGEPYEDGRNLWAKILDIPKEELPTTGEIIKRNLRRKNEELERKMFSDMYLKMVPFCKESSA